MNRRDLLKRFAALPLLPAALRDNRAEPEPVPVLEPTPESVAPSLPSRPKPAPPPACGQMRLDLPNRREPVYLALSAFVLHQEGGDFLAPLAGLRWFEIDACTDDPKLAADLMRLDTSVPFTITSDRAHRIVYTGRAWLLEASHSLSANVTQIRLKGDGPVLETLP